VLQREVVLRRDLLQLRARKGKHINRRLPSLTPHLRSAQWRPSVCTQV